MARSYPALRLAVLLTVALKALKLGLARAVLRQVCRIRQCLHGMGAGQCCIFRDDEGGIAPRVDQEGCLPEEPDDVSFDPVTEEAKKFNRGLAVEAFEDLGLSDDPSGIANWLQRTQGLDCDKLGELLGHPKHQDIMKAYVKKLCLEGLSLEAALRLFLDGFRLPGEAQKIDRIMCSFADHWCGEQPDDADPKLSTDTAYVVSFALIMLNTDLHNPGVKKRMTLQQFQRNLEGVADGGASLPQAWTKALYEGIRDREIVLKRSVTARRRSSVLHLDDEVLKTLSDARLTIRTSRITVVKDVEDVAVPDGDISL